MRHRSRPRDYPLEYLDAPSNRKGHPNENLARELMELFTLGIGNYTEADVKEAARCLTGWGVAEDQFVENAARHDDGEKTVLGKAGKWTGTDLVDQLLKHDATAARLASKLVKTFFGEGACPADAVKELASGLRERDLDTNWAVGAVLKSRLFFADANIRTRVTAPAEFVTSSARALGLFDPAPSTLAMADWSARMGQDLFDPPNVGGWPGGRAWISSRALIARANYAAALIEGPNAGRSVPYDPAAAAKAAGFGAGRADVLTYHHRLLFGADPTAERTDQLAKVDGRKLVIALPGRRRKRGGFNSVSLQTASSRGGPLLARRFPMLTRRSLLKSGCHYWPWRRPCRRSSREPLVLPDRRPMPAYSLLCNSMAGTTR